MWEHAQYIHQPILKGSKWVVWYQNKPKGHNLWIKDGLLRWLKGHLLQNANITSSFPISPCNSSHRQVGISPLHQEAFLTACNFQTQRLRSYNRTQTLSVFFLKNQMAIIALPFPGNICLTKFYLHESTLLSILKRAVLSATPFGKRFSGLILTTALRGWRHCDSHLTDLGVEMPKLPGRGTKPGFQHPRSLSPRSQHH